MESFTDDSLMCGEEAALSLRRLSGENLLPTFSIPKSGRIKSHFEEFYLFPSQISNNQSKTSNDHLKISNNQPQKGKKMPRRGRKIPE